MSVLMSRYLAQELLANSIAGAPVATGPLTGAKVLLFSNNISLQESTVFADLVEPTAAGYARSAALTWAGPYTDGEGNQEVVGDLKNFAFSGNSVPDTIYGYAVVEGGGSPHLLFAERFHAPITPQAGQVIQVAPRFALPEPTTGIEA